MLSSFLLQSTLFFLTLPLMNSIGLFIAQSHDRKHIVPYLLGLVACSACIIASFWVEAAVQALWMNWISARGWEMALIPLWCHSRDKEKRGSFMKPPIQLFVSFFVPTPASLVLWWAHITKWVTHPPPSTQSPLTHPRCSLCYLPRPALPSRAFSSPIDFGPGRKNPNFTPTLWRAGEDGC